MKVSDKIALLQKGVKFSEIADLEKQELEEFKQELKDSEEDEQTPKEEKKKDEKEGAEKPTSEESKEEAEESKENEELTRLQEENKKMKELLHKANILNSGSEKGEEPDKKLTPVDVMNQLFHPEENGGKK